MQISDEDFRGRTVIAGIKLHKAAAEQLGVARGILRAATLELPVRIVQSVGDAVLLSVPTLELRKVLPEADDQHGPKT
jgi:hypothetical protein